MNDEVGIDHRHRRIDFVSLQTIIAAKKVVAGGHTKLHRRGLFLFRRCSESAANHRRYFVAAKGTRFNHGRVFLSRH